MSSVNSLVQNISSLSERIGIEIKNLKENSSSSSANHPYLSESFITITSTTKTLSVVYDPGFLVLYKNRQKLYNGIDFTATDGTTIIFTNDLVIDDVILIIACESDSDNTLVLTEQNVSITTATTSVNVTYDTTFVAVYKNRQRLYKNIDFFADDGNVISFKNSLSSGDVLLIISCSDSSGTIPTHQYASENHSHYGVHALVDHTHEKPVVSVASSSYSFAPVNNTIYNMSGLESLTFTSIPNNKDEILIYIYSGSNGLTLIFPEDVKYIGNAPTGEASKEYVISILGGIVAMTEVQTLE